MVYTELLSIFYTFISAVGIKCVFILGSMQLFLLRLLKSYLFRTEYWALVTLLMLFLKFMGISGPIITSTGKSLLLGLS